MPAALQTLAIARRGSAADPIRVMIVDDSIVARTVLARMLGEQADFAIAGQVGTASAALAKLDHIEVDVILLDLEMPGMSGLAALEALIAKSGGARVLVVSSAAADGAEATLTALRLGAADTLLKPRAGDFAGRFADELAIRLRRIVRLPEIVAPTAAPVAPGPAVKRFEQPVDCIAIGASTGGVPALAAFLGALPAEVQAPILVTQHLPAPFMPSFARQLGDMSGRPARIAADGVWLAPGELLLAPGDAHLCVARMRGVPFVRLDRAPAPSGCRPSVDPMFTSVAAVFGRGAIGVVLSGMGRDGAIGAATLAKADGIMLAQDAASSVVWGMPGAVATAGFTQAVLPPAALAGWIGDRDADGGKGSPWT